MFIELILAALTAQPNICQETLPNVWTSKAVITANRYQVTSPIMLYVWTSDNFGSMAKVKLEGVDLSSFWANPEAQDFEDRMIWFDEIEGHVKGLLYETEIIVRVAGLTTVLVENEVIASYIRGVVWYLPKDGKKWKNLNCWVQKAIQDRIQK